MRFALIILLAVTANSAEWFCRPGVYTAIGGGGVPVPAVGIYGTQDGTSYDNAWNGLRAVVWGASGVAPGDTLWVCGAHVWRSIPGQTWWATSGVVLVNASGTAESQITIRMDNPTESGEVFGFWEDKRRPWEGPDENGVYFQSDATGEPGGVTSVYATYFESDGPPTVGGALTILTNKAPLTTWTTGQGASYIDTDTHTTNFVKPANLVGGTISTNVFSQEGGFHFDLLTSSNIVFQSCRFTASWPRATVQADGSLSANNITFTNCAFNYIPTLWMYAGWDTWTFDGCTFQNMGNGIYTVLNNQSLGASRLTVKNCTFSDIGVGRQSHTPDGRFTHNDSHAIGLQGGTGNVIEHNTIQRTGTAIEFWTSWQKMTNHIVRYNFIKDVYIASVTAGHGIAVSGDNTEAIPGRRIGFQIYGNIILNTGLNRDDDFQGAGISSNNRDSMDILNNTISNCYSGIRLTVSGYPAKGNFRNNIIIAPEAWNLQISGTGAAEVTADYNLFYPSPNVSDKFSLSPTFTHDANSVFADPLLAGGTGAPAYKLTASSPAIGAGINSGVSVDYAGFAWRSPPSIGAYEYWNAASRANSIRVRTIRGK